MEDARRGVEPARAAEATERPLHPADGQPDEQERDEVGDEEGAAAGLGMGDEPGEPEEVAQADGAAGDGHDDAELRAPGLLGS